MQLCARAETGAESAKSATTRHPIQRVLSTIVPDLPRTTSAPTPLPPWCAEASASVAPPFLPRAADGWRERTSRSWSPGKTSAALARRLRRRAPAAASASRAKAAPEAEAAELVAPAETDRPATAGERALTCATAQVAPATPATPGALSGKRPWGSTGPTTMPCGSFSTPTRPTSGSSRRTRSSGTSPAPTAAVCIRLSRPPPRSGL